MRLNFSEKPLERDSCILLVWFSFLHDIFLPCPNDKKIKNHNSGSEENVPLLTMHKDLEEDGNDDF